MPEDEREFAQRRARLALRTHIASAARHDPDRFGSAAHDADDALDVSLPNHVAVIAAGILWVHGQYLSADIRRPSVLGTALAWCARSVEGGDSTRAKSMVIVDPLDPGVISRRARHFSLPITVLSSGDDHAVSPLQEYPSRTAPPPSHLACLRTLVGDDAEEMLGSGGARIVVEHGVVGIEVDGVEVARVVDIDGVARVRIGVGSHDREMFGLVHGETATKRQLLDVVEWVAALRAPGAPPHPLGNLARERAMRQRAVTRPETFGFADLRPVDPPVVRRNLSDPSPCCAVGTTTDGKPALAVFSTGIDLDVVPFAVDAREYHAVGERIIIVTEGRNIVATQRRVADLVDTGAPVSFVEA